MGEIFRAIIYSLETTCVVKLTGPLHSDTASGGLTSALTFSTRTSGAQVRFQRKPKDKITPLRTAQRVKFNLGLDLWRALPVEEKAYWKTLSNFLPLYL